MKNMINKKFTDSQLQEKITAFAKETLSTEEISQAFEKIPHLKDQIANFRTIIELVKDSLNNRFNMDKKTLAIFIGAIVYVIMPIDLIPDFVVGIGWLDDIAVVAWISKNFHTIIATYQTSQTLIDHHINQTIEEKIVSWIEQVNSNINKQYKSLGYKLLIEFCVLGGIVLLNYYFPLRFPAYQLIYIYIGLKMIFGIAKGSYIVYHLLQKIEFFKISSFCLYYKETKNFNEAFLLNMKNFYNYHYQTLTTKSFRIAHKLGNIVKLTPDNEEIFNRICDRLKKNIPNFLKKELSIFMIFFIFYTICIATIRQVTFHHI